MTPTGWFQIGLYLFVIFLVTKPLGVFMTRVFNREKTFLDPVFRPIERLVYRLTDVDEKREMRWTEYAVAMLLFSGVSMVLLYLIERTQKWLPFNPQKFANVDPALAFGTAASFTTNTNWQAYSGESTMSYFTQMAGLAYHNFVSAGQTRQLLGRYDALSFVDSAAGLPGGLPDPGVPRCRAELQAVHDCRSGSAIHGASHGSGRQDRDTNRGTAGNCARAGGFAGSDQGIRHQRRRILQRQ